MAFSFFQTRKRTRRQKHHARRPRRTHHRFAGIERLESRALLAVDVTSISDVGVSFSTADENLWDDKAVVAKSFDYSIGDSFSDSIGGFSAGAGAKVKLTGGLDIGLDGFFNIGGATVDVDYLTDITVTTSGVGAADINALTAGDHVLIGTSHAPDSSGIAMSTEFSGIGAGLDFHFAMLAEANLKGKVGGSTVINKGFGIDIDETVQVLRANFDAPSDTLQLALFGQTIPELSHSNFEISYLDGSAYVPELNTGDPTDSFDDSDWNGERIKNSQLPVDRSQGQTRIDFFRLGFDLAEAMVAQAYIPTDFKFGNDNIGVEGTWISGKLEAYLGVAQKMTFTPTMKVDLNFLDEFGLSTTAMVETRPGSGVFQNVSTKRINLGDEVEIIHPGGVLNIDTDYVVSGSFRNETDIYMSPAATIEVMDAKLKSSVGNTSFTVYRESFPFSAPVPMGSMFDRTFSLDGFSEVDGSDLSLTASSPTSFTLAAAANRTNVKEGSSATVAVTIFDPAAALDDSDIYDLTVNWKDGSTESLRLDNSGSLPAHVVYDALNHQLSISHTYLDRYGLRDVAFDVVKKTPGSSNFDATTATTVPINSKNVAPELTIDSFIVAADGAATVSATYSDPGILDTHDVFVEWQSNRESRFVLPAPGGLTAGDTFIALDEDSRSVPAVLTVTAVDAAAATVSFTIDGYTYSLDEFDGDEVLLSVDDDNGGFDRESLPVPFGLNLTNVVIPASVNEGDEVTISTTYLPKPPDSSGGITYEYRHDVIVNWGDPNDGRQSTFDVYKASGLWVGRKIASSTDDTKLTITQISDIGGGAKEISFKVTREYLDDGDASTGNGTAIDTSAISIEIYDASRDPFGGAFHGTLDVVNIAPTITLDPLGEPIGEGGVMVLTGQLSDPSPLDSLEIEIDWDDGTIETFQVGSPGPHPLPIKYGHIYTVQGNYNVKATVTDDDTGTNDATLPVVVELNTPPIAVDDDVSTDEDTPLVIDVLADNGNGADSDPDGDLDPTLTILDGSLIGDGVLTHLGSGSFQYDPNGQFEYLAEGESTSTQFDYLIEDTAGQTAVGSVSITINGVNDAPVITVGASDSAVETLDETDTPLSTSATLSVADLDTTDTVSVAVSSVAVVGDDNGLGSPALLAMLSVDAGDVIDNLSTTGTINWAFNSGSEAFDHLASGESLMLTYTVVATDSESTVDDQTVTIRINGTNDAPVITVGASDSAAETLDETDTPLSTSATLSVADLDTTDTVSVAVSSVAVVGDDNGLGSPALLAMLSVDAGDVIDNLSTTGTINWAFNSGSEAFDHLASGESLVLTYTVVATDSESTVDDQTVTITLNGTNDAPVMNSLNSGHDTPCNSSADGVVLLNGTFGDLDLSDTHAVTVDWGDESGLEVLAVDQSDDMFTGTHTYATGGVFTITTIVNDGNGGTDELTTKGVSQGVGVVDGTLYIIGTDGRDDIKLKFDNKKDTLKVDAKFSHGSGGGTDGGHHHKPKGGPGHSDGGHDHFKETFQLSLIDRIVSYLCDGNDHYHGGSDGGVDAISQFVFGGAGDDHIHGGRGHDVLVGGEGNDHIKAGRGRDIVIGGSGNDKLKGGHDDDLIVGGVAANQNYLAATDAALSAWVNGSLDSALFELDTFTDDGEKDELKGEKGDDALFGGVGDKVKR